MPWARPITVELGSGVMVSGLSMTKTDPNMALIGSGLVKLDRPATDGGRVRPTYNVVHVELHAGDLGFHGLRGAEKRENSNQKQKFAGQSHC